MEVRRSARIHSPLCDRFPVKHSVVILALLFAGAAGSPLKAQDTSAATAADTSARTRDSLPATGIPGATVPQDTPPSGQGVARPDTLARDTTRRDTLPADTLRRDTTARAPGQGAGSPPDTAAPAAPPPPMDSVLAVACRASGGDPPDLLTVVFRTTATAAEREAAAREVGGRLLGQSRHQAPGAWYVQAPGSGINPLIADRLILLAPVLEVGATRCP